MGERVWGTERVPKPRPADGRPRLAGVRGRRQGQWETLAAQLGSDHLNPILGESNLVLHPGDDHTLEPGEGRRTPVGSVGAAVTPCRRQTADVPLGAAVVRRGRRVIQEGEFTSDEHAAYESAIVTAFSEPEPAPASPSRPGRPRVRPRRRLAPGLVYATVRKERKKGRVVSIRRSIVLGDEPTVEALLKASVCSRTIKTSFVERRHGTDRGQNARKSRRSYRFSKDGEVHVAMSYFTAYRSNFC